MWHITENIPQLQNIVRTFITDSSRPKTENLHWLSSRACLATIFQRPITILKDHKNKPNMLVDGQPFYLSITHSFQYAAVIFSRQTEVGIDIEKLDERINRVKNKFCNDVELEWADNQILNLAMIWSAKETLYKLYGKKELDFKNHLLIQKNDGVTMKGKIDIGVFVLECSIQTKLFDGYILTYTMNSFN